LRQKTNVITGTIKLENILDFKAVPEHSFHKGRATHTLRTHACNCKMNIETLNYVGWKGSLEFIQSIVLLRAGSLNGTSWQHQQGIF